MNTEMVTKVIIIWTALAYGLGLGTFSMSLLRKKIKTGRKRGITNKYWWLCWGIISSGLLVLALGPCVFFILKEIENTEIMAGYRLLFVLYFCVLLFWMQFILFMKEVTKKIIPEIREENSKDKPCD